ncbi:chromate efflux transporter [Sphingomonas sp.]|uniref:chromate efflux transporter n=1 Tax=Sphingomonas sp. TaxID=28214 RepID=UPI00286AB9A9|nr:chromate efflux transporter [Sphingomonas sp.]
MPADDQPPTLTRLFWRFLRFGLLAWGGPVAQIAMIRRALVDDEHWLGPARFNRLLAVYQVMPGPEAHELCVHLGMMKRGRVGGLLAGIGFMLPGFLLMLVLAWTYRRLDLDQPLYAALLLGVQVGVIALIVRAIHRIGEHVLVDRWLWAIALASFVATLAGVGFWLILPAAGLVAGLAKARQLPAAAVILAATMIAVLTHRPDIAAPAAAAGGPSGTVGLVLLFVAGLKAGLLTFGGAYAAIPFVRDDAVGRGWVSDGQFLDGLALSGLIPAPLIIFATFVGFLAGGLGGALAITAGVFLPAFAFTLLFFDRLERVVDDQRLHRLLEGVAAGVVGMIAATVVDLGRAVAQSVPSYPPAAAILGGSLLILYVWRSNRAIVAVILLSALAGSLAF